MIICISYLFSSSWSDEDQKDVVYFVLFNFAPSKGIDEITRKNIKDKNFIIGVLFSMIQLVANSPMIKINYPEMEMNEITLQCCYAI